MNQHWPTDIAIGEFCETGSGGTPDRSKGEYYGGDIPWVKSGELREGLILDTEEHLSELGLKNSSAKLVPSGALLVAMYGATVGRLAVLGCDAATNQAVCNIRPDPTLGDTRYLFRALEAKVPYLVSMATGGAQPNISQEKIRKTKVRLPSLDDQRRIAAILDKADALRQKRKRAITMLDSLTQSIFLEMFGDPAANIHDYPVLPLGRVASKFSDGPFGSNLKSEHYVENGVRVVRLQNIGVGEFIDDDAAYISNEHFRRLVKHQCLPGDVLIATLGDPNLRACVQPASLAQALNKADCVQLRPNLDCVLPEYIGALINLPSVMTMASGLVLGQTRGRISMGRLRDLELPIAPIALQRRFVELVRARNTLSVRANENMVKASALFASLQHRAFSGQL